MQKTADIRELRLVGWSRHVGRNDVLTYQLKAGVFENAGYLSPLRDISLLLSQLKRKKIR